MTCHVTCQKAIYTFTDITNKLFLQVKAFDSGLKLLKNKRAPGREIHTRQKLYYFGRFVARAKLVCLVSSRLPGMECLYGKIFVSVTG